MYNCIQKIKIKTFATNAGAANILLSSFPSKCPIIYRINWPFWKRSNRH
jgi:hypothetical protein